MRLTRLAVAVTLVALLAAGCAGEPTGEPTGGEVEVQGVTSTAAEAAITEPATTQPSATTTRRAATTSQPAATTSQPAANPVLTVIVVRGAAGGMWVNPPGEMCEGTCNYEQFPKGQPIELLPGNPNDPAFKYKFEGGRPPCGDGGPCSFPLLMDTKVTVTPTEGG
jgi:hypothetical protein